MRSAALLVVATVVATVVTLLGGAGKPPAAAAECALPRVSVGHGRYEGSGGGTNEFTFTVRMTASGEDCAMAVRYRTRDGRAAAGSDYTAETGTISWRSPGSHEVVVAVARDHEPE